MQKRMTITQWMIDEIHFEFMWKCESPLDVIISFF